MECQCILAFSACDTHLEAARHDFFGDGNGGARVFRRGAEIDVVQLHHHLADDVVTRVAVEAQHDEVECQVLEAQVILS